MIDWPALYQCLVLSTAIGVISLTLTKAEIFKPLRDWIKSNNAWLGELFSCPYCTSHWLALVAVAVYQPRLIVGPALIVDLAMSVCVIVAASAIVVGLIYRALSPLA